MSTTLIAAGPDVRLRKIERGDLETIRRFAYSVSVTEPHTEPSRLTQLHSEAGFWTDETAAVAIVESANDRMIGTLQCYRAAPCIHGLEIGYVIHDELDRGKGYASQALRLFSEHLFSTRAGVFRQQLIIEVWNTASWKVAERSGFVREGVLRSCGFGVGDPADAFVYSRTRKDHAQALASMNGPG